MPTDWPPFTKVLSEFCSHIKIRNLPASTVKQAKLCFLDWLSAAFAGSQTQAVNIVEKAVKTFGGPPQSTLVGRVGRCPSPFAALVNGTGSAALEMDDVMLDERTPLHPGVAIIPAAFALSEQLNVDGSVLLAGIVSGYEVAARTMKAMGLSHYKFWHSTGTCGALGAAAACSRVLGLDERRFSGALGLGGTQASGLWEQINRDAVLTKHFHAGKANMTGVFSAVFAAEGLLGADTVIEGEKGLMRATSTAGPENAQEALASLGSKFMIESNFFKKYACCRACFEALDSVKLILSREPCRLEEMESIELKTRPPTVWLVGNPNPEDEYQAKFSVQFAVALLLNGHTAGVEDFSSELLHHPTIRDTMNKIVVKEDPHQESRGFVATMKMKNGKCFTEFARSESLDTESVIARFREISLKSVGREASRTIEQYVMSLDQCESLRPLSQSLSNLR